MAALPEFLDGFLNYFFEFNKFFSHGGLVNKFNLTKTVACDYSGVLIDKAN